MYTNLLRVLTIIFTTYASTAYACQEKLITVNLSALNLSFQTSNYDWVCSTEKITALANLASQELERLKTERQKQQNNEKKEERPSRKRTLPPIHSDNDTDNDEDYVDKDSQKCSSTQTTKRQKSNGEKYVTCDNCSKKLSSANALNGHRLIHTGEKPWKCPAFKRCKFAGRLKLHTVRHIMSQHQNLIKKITATDLAEQHKEPGFIPKK